MARKKTRSRKRKSSKRKTTSHKKRRTTRKAARRSAKGHIPLPILEKRAGRLVRLVHKRGGRVK
jgi:hypothetical protein